MAKKKENVGLNLIDLKEGENIEDIFSNLSEEMKEELTNGKGEDEDEQ